MSSLIQRTKPFVSKHLPTLQQALRYQSHEVLTQNNPAPTKKDVNTRGLAMPARRMPEPEVNPLPPMPRDTTPQMPQKSGYDLASCTARRQWVEQMTSTRLQSTAAFYPDEAAFETEQLRGNIERPIGLAKIPLAAAGPLRFRGDHVQGSVFAPMATTEGALVASVCRGAKVLNLSGGVQTWATLQRMTRSPMFFCANPNEAVRLGEWLTENVERIQREVVVRFSKRAQLKEIIPAYDMDACHTLLRYETGDAAGQNMTTVCSWEVAKWAAKHAPAELGVDIRFFSVEGNMSADKKGSSCNALLGRGMAVTAQCDIPEHVLQQQLHVDSATLCEAARFSSRISERIGQLAGFNVNVSNVLAAMFTALGQDIACVHESAISRTEFVKRDHPEGGVSVSLYMPSLVVGTVGGGTKLPTQHECLEMIHCAGVGNVRRLAEIIAGYCLALDVSTYCANVSGEFADSHDRLGRNRPNSNK